MSGIDEEWVRAEVARRGAEQAVLLHAERDLATERGKEPFDLDRFEELYDTETALGYLPPRPDREWRWAVAYYLTHRDVLTMAALAERMEALDVYR